MIFEFWVVRTKNVGRSCLKIRHRVYHPLLSIYDMRINDIVILAIEWAIYVHVRERYYGNQRKCGAPSQIYDERFTSDRRCVASVVLSLVRCRTWRINRRRRHDTSLICCDWRPDAASASFLMSRSTWKKQTLDETSPSRDERGVKHKQDLIPNEADLSHQHCVMFNRLLRGYLIPYLVRRLLIVVDR